LHALGAQLSAEHGLTVIKGERIARRLPAPLLRQSGDVDLVAPDEAALWRCVLDLRGRYAAVVQGVSVIDRDGRPPHIMVAVKWAAPEPLLDKPMGVDVTTFAYGGDFRAVPLRANLPGDEDLAGLLAVAEERFQRKFRVKDHLDLLTLAPVLERRYGDDLATVVGAAATQWALAPELRRLIAGTHQWVPVSPVWQRTLNALRRPAREEQARRRPGRAGVHRLRFGYPLDEHAVAGDAVRIHARDGGDIAETPVGRCLLTDRLVVDEEQLSAAIEDLRSPAAATV
jgi:hypothetical protein